MKTLSLDLRSVEVLTKSELRQVKGGDEVCYCHNKDNEFLGTVLSYDGTSCFKLCRELYGEGATAPDSSTDSSFGVLMSKS